MTSITEGGFWHGRRVLVIAVFSPANPSERLVARDLNAYAG
jgi:hypothetical protein